jgi:hypothetical protein
MIDQGKLKAVPTGNGVGLRYKIKGAWIMAFLGVK